MGGNCATGQDLTPQQEISDAEFSVVPKCKVWKSIFVWNPSTIFGSRFFWNQNVNFGSRHFVIGAKIPGKGMAAVVMGGFLSQFSLEEGQKRVPFASHRKLLRTQFPFMPWRSDLARNGRGLAVI